MYKTIELAKRLKEILENYKFSLDMTQFNSNYSKVVEQECGTSFCLAGYLAHLDGYPAKYRCEQHFDFVSYSESLFGGLPHKLLSSFWYFLFGGEWPNDKELAIERCNLVIDRYDEIVDGRITLHVNYSTGRLFSSQKLPYVDKKRY